MRRFWWIIACCFAAWVLLTPLLQRGVPQTQDGENHLARFAAYASALRQGQFPPRWAPLLNAGYGYPVLNYGYPLANMLATPFVLLKFSIEDIYKVLAASAIFLGAFGVWKCTREILVRDNKTAPWVASAAFLLHSYGWTNLYVRGSIGELWGWSLLPIFFWFSWRALTRQDSKSIWGTFLSILGWGLAHNVVSFLSAPVVCGWLVFLWIRGRRLRARKIVFVPVILGLFSACFFWIPAWFEKDLTVVTETSLSQFTSRYLLSWSEILFAPLNRGLAFAGSVNSMGLGIGLFSVIVLLAGFVTASNKKKFSLIAYIFLFLLICFFVSEWSRFFWVWFPGSQFVQFPWRLLGLLQVLTALSAGVVYGNSKPWLQRLLFAFCILSLVGLSRAPVATFESKPNDYFHTFTQTTTVLNEYRAKSFKSETFLLSPQIPQFSQQVENFSLGFWNGSARQYSFSTRNEVVVEEPTMYFPGWIAKANGKEIAIESRLRDGLIAFELPPGTYTIETRFTQNTWPRLLGNSLSLIGFMAMMLYWVSRRRNHAHS